MDPQAQPARMTADEFEDAFGESEREDRSTEAGCPDLELVDGVVVEGEMPSQRHQRVLRALENQIEPWVQTRHGRTWANPELRLTTHDVREPDLIAWWSGQTAPLDGQMRAIPNLVVEIISSRPRDVRRDREEKATAYAAFGVPHYWLLEPTGRMFEAFVLRPPRARGGYTRIVLAQGGRVLVPGFPNLVLDLDTLWTYVEG
jgi:Uma2 family endonuclease